MLAGVYFETLMLIFFGWGRKLKTEIVDLKNKKIVTHIFLKQVFLLANFKHTSKLWLSKINEFQNLAFLDMRNG